MISFEQAMEAYDRAGVHSQGVQNILDEVRTATVISEPEPGSRVVTRNQHYVRAGELLKLAEQRPDSDSEFDRLIEQARVHAMLAIAPRRVAGE